MTERAKFLDYDARRNPKTNRWCSLCQRDLAVDRPARRIVLRAEDMHVIHPQDATEPPNALLGLDCARRFGLEWSVAE